MWNTRNLSVAIQSSNGPAFLDSRSRQAVSAMSEFLAANSPGCLAMLG